MLPDELHDGGRLALNIGPLRGSAAVYVDQLGVGPGWQQGVCILFSRGPSGCQAATSTWEPIHLAFCRASNWAWPFTLISWALAPASSRECMHFCILFSRVQRVGTDDRRGQAAISTHELVNLTF